jgi:hypothetical protein
MIKKSVVLLAAALLSLNASAGYVQYDLVGGPNANVTGTFIQNDITKGVAAYVLEVHDQYVSAEFYKDRYGSYSDGYTTVFKGLGPTNFHAHENNENGEQYSVDLSLHFDINPTAEGFSFTANFSQQPYWAGNLPGDHPVAYTYRGVATQSNVDQVWSESYDRSIQMGIISYVVPTFIDVPEPTSLGLLAIGAVGIAGAARRRKKLL